ncbi:hypothetical protein [Streptomyces liangshanensis]|uniref:hypothetical protein n=1 Tax=Streptomyces liangshanensis TaxID=2717324 RepID=UPI0036D8FC26
MTKPLPHDPYATAVMAALGDQYDPANSWTEYTSDDGEVMLMEIVINLDDDKAAAAGMRHGAYLRWTQTEGWIWCYATTGDRSYADMGRPVLILVPAPEDVARAVRIILTPGDGPEPLPVPGSSRPYVHGSTLPPALQAAVDGEDIDADTAHALAAYSSPSTITTGR